MFKFIKTAKLQIAVFVLAIGGAFATNAMSSSSTTLVDGYQRIDSEGYDCQYITSQCSEIGTEPCTYEVTSGVFEDLYNFKEHDVTGMPVCTKALFLP